MATYITNTNLSDANRKQLRAIARNVGVAGVTEHSNLSTIAQLLTAIRAK